MVRIEFIHHPRFDPFEFWKAVTVPRNTDDSILNKFQQQNSLKVPENGEEHITCRGSSFELLLDNWWRIFPLRRCGFWFGREMVDRRFILRHNLKQKVFATFMVPRELFQADYHALFHVCLGQLSGHSLCWHPPVSKNIVDDLVSSFLFDSKFFRYSNDGDMSARFNHAIHLLDISWDLHL